MREARNPQGSTPLFRCAPVVHFETCAHGARILQTKNLTGFTSNQLTRGDALETFGRSCAGSGDPRTALRFVPSRHRRVYPGGTVILHYLAVNTT